MNDRVAKGEDRQQRQVVPAGEVGLPIQGFVHIHYALGFAQATHLKIGYATSLTNSDNRSPIMIEVRLVFAWLTTGMIDASPTQRFCIP